MAGGAAEQTCGVAVVGGGLVGLATAAFLSSRGVGCVVLERRAALSPLPRARLVSARSLELFRSIGLDGRIVAAGRPGPVEFEVVDTLQNARTDDPGPQDDTLPLSPTGCCQCDQDDLEPILLDHAVSHGAQVRFGCRVESVRGAGAGVEIEHREAATGRTGSLLARYAVAADGAHSAIRTQLGIPFTGDDDLGTSASVVFTSAELDTLMADRPGTAFVCREAGAFVFRRSDVWQIGFPADGPDGDPATLGRRAAVMVERATGRPGLRIVVVAASSWRIGGGVAERFAHDRTFLAGDAAHVMPPTLGMGGNTGVADAYDLAWKLATVLRGAAGPELLDSYDAERRPVAQRTVEQSVARLHGTPVPDRPTVQLGPHASRATVGHRAPHLWLRRADGAVVSTLDLVGGSDPVVLSVGGERPVAQPAGTVHHHIGPGGFADVDGIAGQRYAGGPGTAWLLRPDGLITWHGAMQDLAGAVERQPATRWSSAAP